MPDPSRSAASARPPGALSYRPRSHSMLLGAWVLWVLALVAVHFELGWALRSAGPPMAILATLALVVYLTTGVTLTIDRARGEVRTRRRLLGVPVHRSARALALHGVELRAAWMHRTRGRTVVYDLVAIGRDPAAPADAEPVELALADDLALFGAAERRARRVAAALALPLLVRWDAVDDDVAPVRREPGDLDRPVETPPAFLGWRTWF